MRLAIAVTATCLSIGGLITADNASAAVENTNIPVEGLGLALATLAKDRNLEILYAIGEIANVHTDGAAGEFTTDEALKRLLTGTGLTFRYLDDKTVTIGSAISPHERSSHAVTTTSSGSSDDANSNQESSSGTFLVAQVDQGKSAVAASPENQPSSSQGNSNSASTGLSEIIVTAQKRSERLLDVPVPVSVISAETLVDNNQTRLQDYYSQVPGLTLTKAGGTGDTTFLTIRGITPVGGNPTVAVTVDDTPYGSSTNVGGGFAVPDIDPNDLARIEVLRGPQGTLYGASSLGGLLKFVTVDPSTDQVSGRVEAGTSSVYNGAELGYNARGSINIPLSDTIAVRASGFTREDPGYIDNPVFGIRGINKTEAYGGRLSALWRPSEELSLKLSAVYQGIKTDGSNEVDQVPGVGDWQQNLLLGTGVDERKVQAYTATLTAKLGSVDLTAISGYNINSFHNSLDIGPGFGAFVGSYFGGVTGGSIFTESKNEKFTQEIRLSVPFGKTFDWLVGGFYTHENSPYSQAILAVDATNGAIVGNFGLIDFPSNYTEYAGFTDLTIHMTDRLDVQIGGRESHISQVDKETDYGLYVTVFGVGPSSPFVHPNFYSEANAFTYLLTPQFKVSPDLMVYARLASGYRPGGPNTTPGEPPQFAPDKTKNYDLGLKGEFLDRTISVDLSLYYIDWKDIQLGFVDPNSGLSYNGNGGAAKSEGAELSVKLKPLTELTVTGWVAYNNAVLTELLPLQVIKNGTYGTSGTRLPLASKLSGNVSAQYDFPLWTSATGFIGGMASYVGDRAGNFATSAQTSQPIYPSYVQVDLRGGVKYGSWSANLYANNVTDRHGVLLGGYPPTYGYLYIQPRTIGLSLVKTF